MKKVIKVLEKNDFEVGEITEQNGSYYIEINQYTPEGEDWYEVIWFDNTKESFINSLKERILYFDIDEEIEVWVDMRGKNGVPSSIMDLIEDAKWKLETLKKLCKKIERIK